LKRDSEEWVTSRPKTAKSRPAISEPSGRHVEFGGEAGIIAVVVGRRLNGDVHLKPMLLAQNEDVLQRKRLNAWRREP
jgi:hypothetical protein